MSPVGALAGLDGLRALRHRNFRLFWSGQLISLIGTWMQQVAQAWLVLTLTNDPFMLGLVATFQFAPVLVFGLFGGIVADSLPKRRTLLVTQSTAMTLAFVLAALVATHTVQVWHILILALLLGCSNAVDMPTRQSFFVEMVGREDIGNAVALNSAIFNSARIIGPAVAGLTIGAFDISIAFFLNGLSFLAVLASLLAMRESELGGVVRMVMPRSVGAVVENLAEGLRYVRQTRIVLLAVGVVGLVATAGMNFSVVMPSLARDVLGTGAQGFGFLMAASGVGSLAAALVIAFGRRPGIRVLIGGAAVLGVLEVVLAASRSMPLSLVAMFGIGAGGIAMAMTANTAIQLAVPDPLRGRVMSVYTTVFAGSTPVGGLAFGALARAFGAASAVFVGGAAVLVIAFGAGIVAWRWGLPSLTLATGRSAPGSSDGTRSSLPGGAGCSSAVRQGNEASQPSPIRLMDDGHAAAIGREGKAQSDRVVGGVVRVVDVEVEPARGAVERVAVGEDLVVRHQAARIGRRAAQQTHDGRMVGVDLGPDPRPGIADRGLGARLRPGQRQPMEGDDRPTHGQAVELPTDQ